MTHKHSDATYSVPFLIYNTIHSFKVLNAACAACSQKNPGKRLKNHMWGHIVLHKHYICSTDIKTDI